MQFDKLLKPYKQGGTKSKPIKRTIGTILDYLLNKKQYPMEIVGGAMFLVFNYLNSGGEFKGDGSYGSKGKELVTAIRMKCDDLLRNRLESEAWRSFLELYGKDLKYHMTPSYKRTFSELWKGKQTVGVSYL